MKRMKQASKYMLEGPLLPGIIRYTIPIILTSVLQLLFNATDLVVVGMYCGSVCVGAVGATNSVTNLLVNLFIGLSVGAGVSVAHGMGSRNDEEVQNTVHTAIMTALLGGAILTVVGVFCSEPLLRLMGTPEETLPLSALYMKIFFGGITFNMVYNYGASILRASGDTKSPLIYLCMSGVINVVLNVIFITVFGMSVDGVALATVIAIAFSATCVTRALMRRTDCCRLELKKLKIHPVQLRKIIRIGLPAGIQGSLFSISNVIVQSSVNSFGDVFVAGNSASASIEGFMYVMLNAFQQATVNFVGQNVGARQYRRANKTVWLCFGCVIVVGLSMGVLICTFGEQLLGIYIKDSPQAIADGMIRLTFMSIPYFIIGLMEISTGALRGYGASMIPMIVSILGVCGIRLGWIYTVFQIPQFHTPQSLYLSYPVSWSVTFIVQFIFFLLLVKKYPKSEHL